MSPLLITTAAGLELLVRIVLDGARYGRDDALTNTYGQPLVEFYDPTGPGPFGNFVARYTLATLGDHGSLSLDMGNPRYNVDHEAADTVREWANR